MVQLISMMVLKLKILVCLTQFITLIILLNQYLVQVTQRKVIFLTADAFGVLPPVSKLTPEQTKYYFLSGFTAKLAGTERGITEPTPTFSACFGAAFLTLHPTQYAQVLVKTYASCWLQKRILV